MKHSGEPLARPSRFSASWPCRFFAVPLPVLGAGLVPVRCRPVIPSDARLSSSPTASLPTRNRGPSPVVVLARRAVSWRLRASVRASSNARGIPSSVTACPCLSREACERRTASTELQRREALQRSARISGSEERPAWWRFGALWERSRPSQMVRIGLVESRGYPRAAGSWVYGFPCSPPTCAPGLASRSAGDSSNRPIGQEASRSSSNTSACSPVTPR